MKPRNVFLQLFLIMLVVMPLLTPQVRISDAPADVDGAQQDLDSRHNDQRLLSPENRFGTSAEGDSSSSSIDYFGETTSDNTGLDSDSDSNLDVNYEEWDFEQLDSTSDIGFDPDSDTDLDGKYEEWDFEESGPSDNSPFDPDSDSNNDTWYADEFTFDEQTVDEDYLFSPDGDWGPQFNSVSPFDAVTADQDNTEWKAESWDGSYVSDRGLTTAAINFNYWDQIYLDYTEYHPYYVRIVWQATDSDGNGDYMRLTYYNHSDSSWDVIYDFGAWTSGTWYTTIVNISDYINVHDDNLQIVGDTPEGDYMQWLVSAHEPTSNFYTYLNIDYFQVVCFHEDGFTEVGYNTTGWTYQSCEGTYSLTTDLDVFDFETNATSDNDYDGIYYDFTEFDATDMFIEMRYKVNTTTYQDWGVIYLYDVSEGYRSEGFDTSVTTDWTTTRFHVDDMTSVNLDNLSLCDRIRIDVRHDDESQLKLSIDYFRIGFKGGWGYNGNFWNASQLTFQMIGPGTTTGTQTVEDEGDTLHLNIDGDAFGDGRWYFDLFGGEFDTETDADVETDYYAFLEMRIKCEWLTIVSPDVMNIIIRVDSNAYTYTALAADEGNWITVRFNAKELGGSTSSVQFEWRAYNGAGFAFDVDLYIDWIRYYTFQDWLYEDLDGMDIDRECVGYYDSTEDALVMEADFSSAQDYWRLISSNPNIGYSTTDMVVGVTAKAETNTTCKLRVWQAITGDSDVGTSFYLYDDYQTFWIPFSITTHTLDYLRLYIWDWINTEDGDRKIYIKNNVTITASWYQAVYDDMPFHDECLNATAWSTSQLEAGDSLTDGPHAAGYMTFKSLEDTNDADYYDYIYYDIDDIPESEWADTYSLGIRTRINQTYWYPIVKLSTSDTTLTGSDTQTLSCRNNPNDWYIDTLDISSVFESFSGTIKSVWISLEGQSGTLNYRQVELDIDWIAIGRNPQNRDSWSESMATLGTDEADIYNADNSDSVSTDGDIATFIFDFEIGDTGDAARWNTPSIEGIKDGAFMEIRHKVNTTNLDYLRMYCYEEDGQSGDHFGWALTKSTTWITEREYFDLDTYQSGDGADNVESFLLWLQEGDSEDVEWYIDYITIGFVGGYQDDASGVAGTQTISTTKTETDGDVLRIYDTAADYVGYNVEMPNISKTEHPFFEIKYKADSGQELELWFFSEDGSAFPYYDLTEDGTWQTLRLNTEELLTSDDSIEIVGLVDTKNNDQDFYVDYWKFYALGEWDLNDIANMDDPEEAVVYYDESESAIVFEANDCSSSSDYIDILTVNNSIAYECRDYVLLLTMKSDTNQTARLRVIESVAGSDVDEIRLVHDEWQQFAIPFHDDDDTFTRHRFLAYDWDIAFTNSFKLYIKDNITLQPSWFEAGDYAINYGEGFYSVADWSYLTDTGMDAEDYSFSSNGYFAEIKAEFDDSGDEWVTYAEISVPTIIEDDSFISIRARVSSSNAVFHCYLSSPTYFPVYGQQPLEWTIYTVDISAYAGTDIGNLRVYCDDASNDVATTEYSYIDWIYIGKHPQEGNNWGDSMSDVDGAWGAGEAGDTVTADDGDIISLHVDNDDSNDYFYWNGPSGYYDFVTMKWRFNDTTSEGVAISATSADTYSGTHYGLDSNLESPAMDNNEWRTETWELRREIECIYFYITNPNNDWRMDIDYIFAGKMAGHQDDCSVITTEGYSGCDRILSTDGDALEISGTGASYSYVIWGFNNVSVEEYPFLEFRVWSASDAELSFAVYNESSYITSEVGLGEPDSAWQTYRYNVKELLDEGIGGEYVQNFFFKIGKNNDQYAKIDYFKFYGFESWTYRASGTDADSDETCVAYYDDTEDAIALEMTFDSANDNFGLETRNTSIDYDTTDMVFLMTVKASANTSCQVHAYGGGGTVFSEDYYLQDDWQTFAFPFDSTTCDWDYSYFFLEDWSDSSPSSGTYQIYVKDNITVRPSWYSGESYGESFASVDDWSLGYAEGVSVGQYGLTTDGDVCDLWITLDDAGYESVYYRSENLSMTTDQLENMYYEYRYYVEDSSKGIFRSRLYYTDSSFDWINSWAGNSEWTTMKGHMNSIVDTGKTIWYLAIEVVDHNTALDSGTWSIYLDYFRFGNSTEMGWQDNFDTVNWIAQAGDPQMYCSGGILEVVDDEASASGIKITTLDVDLDYYPFLEFKYKAEAGQDVRLRVWDEDGGADTFYLTEDGTWQTDRFNIYSALSGDELTQIDLIGETDGDQHFFADYIQCYSIANHTVTMDTFIQTTEYLYVDSNNDIVCEVPAQADNNYWITIDNDINFSVDTSTYNMLNVSTSNDVSYGSDCDYFSFREYVDSTWTYIITASSQQTTRVEFTSGTFTDYQLVFAEGDGMTLGSLTFFTDSEDPQLLDFWIVPYTPDDETQVTMTVYATDSSGYDLMSITFNPIDYPTGFTDQDYIATKSPVQGSLWNYTFTTMLAGYYAWTATANDGTHNATDILVMQVVENKLSITDIVLITATEDLIQLSGHSNKPASYGIYENDSSAGSGSVSDGWFSISWAKSTDYNTYVKIGVLFTNGTDTEWVNGSYSVGDPDRITVDAISFFGVGDDFDMMTYSFYISHDCSYVINEASDNVPAADTHSGTVSAGTVNLAWDKLTTTDTLVNFTITFTNGSLTYTIDGQYQVAQIVLQITERIVSIAETTITFSAQASKDCTYTLYLDDSQEDTDSISSGSFSLNWTRTGSSNPSEISFALKFTDGITTVWVNNTYDEYGLTADAGFVLNVLVLDKTAPNVTLYVSTSYGNSTVYLYENDTLKDSGSEGTTLSYLKGTSAGTYNIYVLIDAGVATKEYNDTYTISAVSLDIDVEDWNVETASTLYFVGSCNAPFQWWAYREGVFLDNGTISSSTNWRFTLARQTGAGEWDYAIYFNSTSATGSRWYNVTDYISATFAWTYVNPYFPSGEGYPLTDFRLYVNGTRIYDREWKFYNRTDYAYNITITDAFDSVVYNNTASWTRHIDCLVPCYSFSVSHMLEESYITFQLTGPNGQEWSDIIHPDQVVKFYLHVGSTYTYEYAGIFNASSDATPDYRTYDGTVTVDDTTGDVAIVIVSWGMDKILFEIRNAPVSAGDRLTVEEMSAALSSFFDDRVTPLQQQYLTGMVIVIVLNVVVVVVFGPRTQEEVPEASPEFSFASVADSDRKRPASHADHLKGHRFRKGNKAQSNKVKRSSSGSKGKRKKQPW